MQIIWVRCDCIVTETLYVLKSSDISTRSLRRHSDDNHDQYNFTNCLRKQFDVEIEQLVLETNKLVLNIGSVLIGKIVLFRSTPIFYNSICLKHNVNLSLQALLNQTSQHRTRRLFAYMYMYVGFMLFASQRHL